MLKPPRKRFFVFLDRDCLSFFLIFSFFSFSLEFFFFFFFFQDSIFVQRDGKRIPATWIPAKSTGFQIACEKGHLEIIKLLVKEEGLDVKSRDEVCFFFSILFDE